MNSPRTMIVLGAFLIPAVAASQSPGAGISEREIEAHVKFLSSDLLEGRGAAVRGGRIAAEYIAAQLQQYGVDAGVNGSYFQSVPIDIVATDAKTLSVTASGKATARLRYPEDVVVWAGSAKPRSDAEGELVFVGYGASAREYNWDDFKDQDFKDKILLVLVNDPPAPVSEPNLFGGKAMTYYGRWTYKFEEAERRGAVGMLIVHTTERAGYGWHVVRGSWAKEQRMLPRDPKLPAPLAFQGWIADSAATTLLSQAGLSMAELRKRAESRDFRPVATGITLRASLTNSVQHLKGQNVVGVLRGRDAKLRNEFVAFSSHYDHHGIGPVVNGDSIYNGAADNASGVARILAIARAAAVAPRPKRSLLFVFVDAEESGLLGSAYFAQNPTVPAQRIVANVNVDGGANVFHGRFRDLDVLGAKKSTLGPMLESMVRGDGIRLSPEGHPEAGHFYRSDHFSFAKVGIPSVSVGEGTDIIGREKGWGQKEADDYTANRYHQPSDENRPGIDFSGNVQLAEIVYRFGMQLANAAKVPEWNSDAEFKAVREASRKSRSR